MPLAQTVDSLDSIPEAARGAYVAKDGKFVLDFEVPDVDGLRKHNKMLSDENATRRHALSAWEKLGKSPADFEAIVDAERVKAEDALKKAGKFDEVLATHLGNAKKERDDAVGKAETQRQAALRIAESAVVNANLSTSLTKAKASAEGMSALPKLIGDRVKIEFDDAGAAKTTIYEADGKTPMVGSGAGGLATFDDLVKEATKTYSSLFEGTGSGSGKDPNQQRDAGGKTMTRKEFEALDANARMEKIKAKFTVVD